jgi:sialate O-acetylesterase
MRKSFFHFGRTCLLLLLVLLLDVHLPLLAQAEVRVPKVFGDHMVLQRDKPIVIWGWAAPNENLTVELGSGHSQIQANANGEWKTTLPPLKASATPVTLLIKGSNTIRFEDILVGEVWLASGQSNMEMGIGMCQNAKEEIAAADHPNIRLLMIPNRWTPQPEDDFVPGNSGAEGIWKLCSPKTVAEGGWSGFSAAAYYFGRELEKQLSVPIGLIDTTWGGTRIESWTPPEGFASVPALARDYEAVQLGDPRTSLHKQRLEETLQKTEQWLSEARQAMAAQRVVPPMPTYPAELMPPHDLQNPTALFNGMVHPLCPFAIRGGIWYQGESNAGEGRLYTERMKALIAGWRQIWGQGEFPFYFVQIAPYNYGGDAERIGEFWEAQAAAAKEIPNAGMAVINDIGNLKDIHPTNKQEVGRRLALLALSGAYEKSGVVASGPTFRNLRVEGDHLRILFDNAKGLASRDDKPLSWFEIIDAEEGGFVPAEAKIDGSTVVLSSPEVKHAVAMRFAWSMLAEPNLINGAGLPARAFRAGNVPKRDLLALKVPEAKNYKLVYDLDLAKVGPNPVYGIDNSATIKSGFDRIAYCVEVEGADGQTQFVYVSMDAFSHNLSTIGIPTAQCGARFQQNITHMNVYSNVKGIATGADLAGGNIEFWPNNYSPNNAASVPGASSQVYDFGDEPSDPTDGYGSMQVHNHDAKQTIFAVNHWREGDKADIGIGNQSQGNPDWTFAGNAGSYKSKRLRVLVRSN